MGNESFDEKALSIIKKNKLNPQEVDQVLSRLLATMPHLKFEIPWTVFEEKKGDSYAHRVKGGAHCHVQINKAHIAILVKGHAGPIHADDLEILESMCREASDLVKAAAEIGVSLADFGGRAMSNALSRRTALSAAQIRSYFKSLRSLSGETYENQRIPYGLILLDSKDRPTSAVLEFDNKRFKRLTDGFSTAMVLGAKGAIKKLTHLTTQREERTTRLGRPSWLAPLADTAHKLGGIGVALTRSGDMLVVKDRELLLSQRAGEWRLWRHDKIMSAMHQAHRTDGASNRLKKVLSILYMVALDLSFRRSGGLLVVTDIKDISPLIAAKGDLINAPKRSPAEQALDSQFSDASVFTINRKVLTDLASLDGALVVRNTGKLIAYGAMVSPSKDTTEQGARTRAAIGASAYGLAIKASSDGGISIYKNGVRVIAL